MSEYNYGECNYYDKVQIKAGELLLRNYAIGDKTELKNGVYIGREGLIVVNEGKFICNLKSLFTKWGDELNTDIILDNNAMVNKAIQSYFTNHSDEKEAQNG